MIKKNKTKKEPALFVNQKIPADLCESEATQSGEAAAEERPAGTEASKPYAVPDDEVQTLSDVDLSGVYSYANYFRWKIDERLELIKGKIFEMSAPSAYHQRYTGRIYAELYIFLKNHKCEAFISPFDVRFPTKSKEDKDIYTVLQPDICVICDPDKIDRRGCIGAPDVVVEVLSPSNSKKELYYKFEVYQEHQVREYWIIHPDERCFLKYVLNEDGVFIAGQPYTGDREFVSDILPGFRLNVEEIFI